MRHLILWTGILLGSWSYLGAQVPDSLNHGPDSLAYIQAKNQAFALVDSLTRASRRDTLLPAMATEAIMAVVRAAEARRDTTTWLEAMEKARFTLRRQRAYTQVDSLLVIAQSVRVRRGYDLQGLAQQLAGKADETRYGLRHVLSYWRDSSGQATLAQVWAGLDSLPFVAAQPMEEDWETFHGTYWAQVRLHHQDSVAVNHFFAFNRRISDWDTLDFYLYHAGTLIAHHRTGNAVPPAERSISTSPTTVQLRIPPQSQTLLLVRLAGPSPDDPPTYLNLSHVAFFDDTEEQANDRFVNGIFQGIVLIQLMYFLLFFISTRDPIYGYYVLYILGLSLFIVTSNYSPEYISPQVVHPGLLYLLSVWLATVGLYRFSAAYLKFREVLPGWVAPSQVMQLLFTVLAGIMAVGLLFLSKTQFAFAMVIGVTISLMTLFILLSLIFMFVWGIQALRRGYVPARFYLLASTSLILGMMVPMILFFIGAILQDAERFIAEDTVTTLMQGGIALQLSLFALAVGHQRNQLEKEKRDALEQNLAMQRRINTATERFVPYEFLHSLGRNSILDVHLGDQVEKEVTVFFSDIRGYTTLSEQMTPRENFRFLNSYLGRVGPIIKANRGFVNQYFGDGIMALFMPPEPGVSSPRDAVEASIQMQEKLRIYNAERLAKGRQPILTGIGLHSGPLMLGVIGDTRRMDVGVVSDTVNTAARMEGLTKYYGAGLLASEYTLAGIPNPEDFAHRYLGKVLVKGKVEPLGIYEFLDADTPEQAQAKADTMAVFVQSLEAYFARDFGAAVEGFAQVIAHNPGDRAARLYYQRALEARDQGVPDTWTGVETMLSK